MITFGLDISHHQDLALDLAQCRRDGCEFVFLKATEGATFTDSEFAANLAEARAAGLLVAAYIYQRAGVSAAAHVERVKAVVPRDVPVIPDVEAGSGSLALTRDLINGLRAAGYRVPLLYLPVWYWRELGSPSLGGLPPLWSSRYPDNIVGTLADEWANVPAHYWNGYGGLPVAVLQFTSSSRIAGHQPLDANAFRGTRAELAALLGGQGQEDDMTPQEFLDTKVKWWDGREVPVKDILAEVYMSARGLAGKPGFEGEKAVVNLPPLTDIKAAIGAPVPVTLDYDQLAAKVVEKLDGAKLAKAINDDAARRMAE
ncbi:glycoside hydrolase family 25 protein [Amycolatopsis speibonae]|uniref:Glycoside hydrolase family 25 protein n=1 Tax=Amycolatopsis speibonae TaxID=1450224 RepID=A0ABV7P6B5_9PSEU